MFKNLFEMHNFTKGYLASVSLLYKFDSQITLNSDVLIFPNFPVPSKWALEKIF